MVCRVVDSHLILDVDTKLMMSPIYLIANLFNIQTGEVLRTFRMTAVSGYPTEESISKRVVEYEVYLIEKYNPRFNRCIITHCEFQDLLKEERRHVRIMRKQADKAGYRVAR